jgi:hypothetical protein
MRWVARDLELKVTIVAFMKQNARSRPLNREAAQHKRSRCKAEILADALALRANHLDQLCLSKSALREHQIAMRALQNLAGPL